MTDCGQVRSVHRHVRRYNRSFPSGPPPSCVMFAFYSNRLGCLGSLAVSIALSLGLVLLFRLL